jgi:endonuclease/exonuclease/phosphatase family metal-dependent hydrolase
MRSQKIYLLLSFLLCWSNACPEKIVPPTAELPAPEGLALDQQDAGHVQLSWTYDSPAGTYFSIDRKRGIADWQAGFVLVSIDTRKYTDQIDTESDTVYTYRIRVTDGTDFSPYSANIALFNTQHVPIVLRLKQIDETGIRLSWIDQSVGEEGLVIDRKVSNADWQHDFALLPANTEEYFDNLTGISDSVYYRVRVYSGISASPNSSPQGIQLGTLSPENLFFGTDQTLEVMTWNLQSFARDGQTTVDYLTRFLRALEVDIIALQEIESSHYFNILADSLEGWSAYRANSAGFDINLAYLYKTDAIQVNRIFEITEFGQRPFLRYPLVLEASWRQIPFIIINNHYKCCGDGVIQNDSWDEEYRRREASQLLDQYITSHYPDQNVIVVGDMNDELTDVENANVFWIFIQKSAEYRFADMSIATGDAYHWSYPTWPSHIDHILISNELFDEYQHARSVIQTLHIEKYLPGGWNEYAIKISDHRPVGFKLWFESN